MPKLKTRRAAAKRFRASGSGKKIMRRKAFKNHLLQHKGAERRNRLSHAAVVHERDEDNVRLMLPYL
ncbi:MAG: 50S ribosomal protein L35 [Aphanothece sp. CMT-3BRIN-NPC111]|jgi:large subunit ribosomal protein L35|nr:50S ribosomal protein L35 [Aphanothece sp. CMT-3BRIN-NPC111]